MSCGIGPVTIGSITASLVSTAAGTVFSIFVI
jgi:hypothetical protein